MMVRPISLSEPTGPIPKDQCPAPLTSFSVRRPGLKIRWISLCWAVVELRSRGENDANTRDTASLEPEVRGVTLNEDDMEVLRILGILLVPYTIGKKRQRFARMVCRANTSKYVRFSCVMKTLLGYNY